MAKNKSETVANYYKNNFFSSMLMHVIFLIILLIATWFFARVHIAYIYGGAFFIVLLVGNFSYMKIRNNFSNLNLLVNSMLILVFVEYIIVLLGGVSSPMFGLLFFMPISFALVYGKVYSYVTLVIIYVFYAIFELILPTYQIENNWFMSLFPFFSLLITGPFGSLITERYIDVEAEKSSADRQRKKVDIFANKLDKAYRELQVVDIAKSDFISIASHQLRTPLSIIKGYLSMLLEGDYGTIKESQRKPITNTMDTVSELAELVNELLTGSNIEKGTFALSKTDIDIYKLIDETVEMYENKYAIKNLYIKFEKPENSELIINIDREKIKQVLINLVENAYDYMFKGGITISLEKLDKKVVIKFADTGIGIAETDNEKLFKRFVRLDNAKKIRPDGSGIGLFTSKYIVEFHKGKIWFQSKIGEGTSFFVELPIGELSPNKTK